jgi:hypothetical protein
VSFRSFTHTGRGRLGATTRFKPSRSAMFLAVGPACTQGQQMGKSAALGHSSSGPWLSGESCLPSLAARGFSTACVATRTQRLTTHSCWRYPLKAR